jgi:transcriptional regulator
VYIPPAFDASAAARCHALIDAYSFGTLVTVDESNAPFATHLPFVLETERGPLGTLLGHVARPNPQWRHFQTGRPALAIFQGPHAYVSPRWYEAHPSVPTWNYVTVHAYGTPVLVEEPARVRALLARLVHLHEQDRPDAWSLATLPEEYATGMMRGIVAFEIPITRLEGKAKLSQNRSAADQARVREALAGSGDPLAAAVAELMAARVP